MENIIPTSGQKGFFKQETKGLTITEKIDKVSNIKIENYYSKGQCKDTKTEAMNWGRLLVTHITDKRFVSRI